MSVRRLKLIRPNGRIRGRGKLTLKASRERRTLQPFACRAEALRGGGTLQRITLNAASQREHISGTADRDSVSVLWRPH